MGNIGRLNNNDGNGAKKARRVQAKHRPNVVIAAEHPSTVTDLTPSMNRKVDPLPEEQKRTALSSHGLRTYLIVSTENSKHLIKGKYDFYICSWKDSLKLLEDYTNDLPLGEVANLSLRVVEWTDVERDAYYQQHGIEVG